MRAKLPVMFTQYHDKCYWVSHTQNKKFLLEKVRLLSPNNIYFPDGDFPRVQTSYVSHYIGYIPNWSTQVGDSPIPPFVDGDAILLEKPEENNLPSKFIIKFHRQYFDRYGNQYLIILGLQER